LTDLIELTATELGFVAGGNSTDIDQSNSASQTATVWSDAYKSDVNISSVQQIAQANAAYGYASASNSSDVNQRT